jgi:hypothetical protein
MTHIDRLFCTTEWEELFPAAHLQAWASTISNHCPLILQGETTNARFKGFRFESYWFGLPGFQDVVKEAWQKPLLTTDPVCQQHIKLARSTKAMKAWEKTSICNIKAQLAMANEVIWQLDKAQERRILSAAASEFKEKKSKTLTSGS